MTALVDVWRAVEPGARVRVEDDDALRRPVRGIARTRAAAPHLPPLTGGELLVVDAELLRATSPDELFGAVAETGGDPVAIWVAGSAPSFDLTGLAPELSVLHGDLAAASVTEAANRYLERGAQILERFALDLRLAMAEAALGDPMPATPAALVATALRRGVAVAADAELLAVLPRAGGRSLAARFAATFYRTFAASPTRRSSERRTRDGLWLWERPVRTGASVWLFDDIPFSRTDRVAGDALAVTLRALLTRRETVTPQPLHRDPAAEEAGRDDSMRTTLLAVARANGRVAPAARALGVHRNTVLYRLRRASRELGIDPRRSADALRLLGETDRRD